MPGLTARVGRAPEEVDGVFCIPLGGGYSILKQARVLVRDQDGFGAEVSAEALAGHELDGKVAADFVAER